MARKRQAAKPAERTDEKPVKLTLTLSPRLAMRFGVHAEMSRLSKSELFAELVETHCRRWVVSDRQAREDGPAADVEGEAA